MPRKGSADVIALNFRLPKKLHKRLEQEAKRNTTSINAEMLSRLEDSLEYEGWRETREWLILALTAGLASQPEAAAKVKTAMDQLIGDSDKDLWRDLWRDKDIKR